MPHNEALRRQRILHNWRMADLADQLGTTTTAIKRWERGTQRPSMYYRTKLCALFGLSALELGFEVESAHSPQPSEQETPSLQRKHAEQVGLWTVPYNRNPHFTGRNDLLLLLEQRLLPGEMDHINTHRPLALTQIQALTGLGGIGKTQIAVEYAYRAFVQNCYHSTFWISATNEEAIIMSFASLAERISAFPSHDETDQHKQATAVVHWLEQAEQPWLIIFDNVDDLSILQPYLPRCRNGSILLTTRVRAVGSFASAIEVGVMDVAEGMHFLLQRGQGSDQASKRDMEDARALVLALGRLPLALDQAGAYIEETTCSIEDYLQMYQKNRYTLLARRGMQASGYPESVATTWSLSFERIKETNLAAAAFLSVCAILAPDHIPQELLTEGTPYWSPILGEAVSDPLRFNQIMEDLLRFSLIQRLATDRLLSIHRLVQVVQLEDMSPQEQRQWAEGLVHVIHKFVSHNPKGDPTLWSYEQRYLEQALNCASQIQQHHFLFAEAADVLEWTGVSLVGRASYLLAEPLLLQALSIREQQKKADYPAIAKTLNNLALLFYEQGMYTQAEQHFQRALHIGEQQMELNHPVIGIALNGLAALNRVQGTYTLSEEFYQRAIDVWEQQQKPLPHRTAESLDGLAVLYQEQGKYAQSETLFQRALHVCDEQELEQTQLSSLLDGLANVYTLQGKYVQAEPLYQRSLSIQERLTGPEHPLVAYVLSNLSVLSLQQGKYEQAERLCQRALHIWEQQGEHDHPQIVYPLNNLAKIYFYQGKYEQAESFSQRALHIWEQQGEHDHPQIVSFLNTLTHIYLHQGKYEQAEPVCQRALRILEQHGKDEHPQMVYCLHRCAFLAAQQGKETEADALYQRTLQLCQQVLGSEHRETAEILSDFADFQQARNSISAALDLYQRSLMIYEHVLGKEHEFTRTIRTRLDSLVHQT